MTPPAHLQSRIRNESELLRHWNGIEPGIDFDRRTLWICFLDRNDELIPTIVPIDGVPVDPQEQFVGNLTLLIAGAVGRHEVGSAVLLLTRPGLGLIGKSDRRWAATVRAHFVPMYSPWPLALLTRDRPAAMISEQD